MIRSASIEDAPAIHSMLIELAESMNVRSKLGSTADDICGAMSGHDPAIYVLMAEQNQQSVGVAIFFRTFSTWRGTRGVYLQDIFLSPTVRGCGLGKRMLGAVVEWATAHGADHLRLSVDRANKSAQSFYTATGMSLRSDEMIYEISGDRLDELGMAR